VYIEQGRIVEIGSESLLVEKYPDTQRLDADKQYVMPGNICAHTHFYGAFARGMNIPGPAPENFIQILQKLWWPLDLALDEMAVRYSALVCLVDAIKHGTTTLFDHHASPNFIPGSLDVLAEAVDEAGLRAVLCYEVSDRNGEDGTLLGIQENLRFINRLRAGQNGHGRLAAAFGLHASLTLLDKTLEACRTAAPDGIGFHVHVAEDQADQVDCQTRYGMRVVNRLEKFGMLGPNSIFVHAVHVDPTEIALLAESQTWVTHQPRSNMNNAVGIGDVDSMLRAGVKVCLGNDGFPNAMWEEWKTAYLVHKIWNHDPRCMPASDIVRMAIDHNVSMVNHFFPNAHLGEIAVGAAADLIFVDYHPYTPITVENLPWHIVFGFHESMITTTMVDGKLLMYKNKLQFLDEAEIASQAMRIVPDVWQRYQANISKYQNQ
jgi:putative selenium metabolism protein SsnA